MRNYHPDQVLPTSSPVLRTPAAVYKGKMNIVRTWLRVMEEGFRDRGRTVGTALAFGISCKHGKNDLE